MSFIQNAQTLQVQLLQDVRRFRMNITYLIVKTSLQTFRCYPSVHMHSVRFTNPSTSPFVFFPKAVKWTPRSTTANLGKGYNIFYLRQCNNTFSGYLRSFIIISDSDICKRYFFNSVRLGFYFLLN